MDGGQRKNHFASPIVLDGTQYRYKVKRKKPGFSGYDLDMKSHISLKWDDSKANVVAKTEQIGISRRELVPFADSILPCNNILADVVIVPPEIFRLDNLADVLTYEVWHNCLTESEKHILTQFLPKCSNPDRVVQQLFSGENFHFGNPFLKWGALLCSGNLHPDNVLTTERCFRASKKRYYSELQIYHTDMIENLRMWKERSMGCKDLKEDIIQLMWRSRNNSKKRIFTPEPGVEENVYTTPESSCRGASEIVCSNDNLNGFVRIGEISGRKCSTATKADNSTEGELRKEETLLKHNGQHGDGARYMSYIKVSKSQHQRIKSSMKHGSSSIQPKSLNNVLGNIDALCIQPFEVFEEEEWQKLHDHWLKIAVRDLPPFVANWRILQSHRIQIAKSVGQEMEEKLKCQNESIDQDKEESSCDVPLEPLYNLDTNFALTEMKEFEVAAASMPVVELPEMTFEETSRMIQEEVPTTATILDESPSMTEEEAPAMAEEEAPTTTEEEWHEMTEVESPTMTNEESHKLSEEDELQSNGSMKEQRENGLGEVGLVTFEDNEGVNSIRDANNFVSVSTRSDHIHQTVPLKNGCHHYDPMNIETHDNLNLKKDEGPPSLSKYPLNLGNIDVPVNQEDSIVSAVDTWPQVNMNIETRNNLDLKKEECSPSSSKYPLNLGNIDVPLNQEDSIASAVDTWPQVDMPGLFYSSTSLSHGYSSSNELSLGHPQVEEQSSQRLRLEAFSGERIGGRASVDAFNGERIGGRDALPRHSGPLPFFSPYHSQDQNELYQSFYKSETDLSYQHEEKQTGINFQPATNLVVETGQFSGRMREQLHSSLPLELRHKGLSDFYLNQSIQESMYCDGGSYHTQRQETLPLNVGDWAANTVPMSTPPQSHMNGGRLTQTWYAGDNPARGSWSCMEGVAGPSQGIGSGSSSDQSLFSVLSECNELQSGSQYDPMTSSQQFIQSGNYGGVNINSHILPQPTNSLNYLTDLDSTPGYKTVTCLGMNNIQHQSPGLEETIDSKTFLRSWNQ